MSILFIDERKGEPETLAVVLVTDHQHIYLPKVVTVCRQYILSLQSSDNARKHKQVLKWHVYFRLEQK